MGYMKRKSSNAGKVTLGDFEELKEFLADVKAEVLMNDILIDLVFNWDQTGIHLVPTGDWTMHQAKEKIVPISHSDDKGKLLCFRCDRYWKILSPTTHLSRKDRTMSPKVC